MLPSFAQEASSAFNVSGSESSAVYREKTEPRRISKLVVTKYVFWIAFVVFSMTAAIYQCQEMAGKFFQPPHYITKSRFVYEPYPVFPNITICNYNRANLTKVQQLGLTNRAIEHLFLALPTTYQMRSVDFTESFEKGSTDWAKFMANASVNSSLKDPANLLRYLGHSCEGTFITCRFGDMVFPCCDEAVQVISKEFGACWVINAAIFTENDTVPKQPWRGQSAGLKIVVNPGVKEYVRNATMNNFLEEGVLVLPTFNPHQGTGATFAAVSPGKHAGLAMSKRAISHKEPLMEVFTQDCIRDGSLRYTEGTYNSAACRDECLQDHIIETCHCYVLQQLKVDLNVTACDGDAMAQCVDSNLLMIDQHGPTNKIKQCESNCGTSCLKTWEIDTVNSLNRFPGDHISKSTIIEVYKNVFLVDYTDTPEVGETILVLDIFFPEVFYTEVESTERQSVFEFVGELGGALGFWLGMSLVSLMYLLGILLQAIRTYRAQRTADSGLAEMSLLLAEIADSIALGGGRNHVRDLLVSPPRPVSPDTVPFESSYNWIDYVRTD